MPVVARPTIFHFVSDIFQQERKQKTHHSDTF